MLIIVEIVGNTGSTPQIVGLPRLTVNPQVPRSSRGGGAKLRNKIKHLQRSVVGAFLCPNISEYFFRIFHPSVPGLILKSGRFVAPAIQHSTRRISHA